MANTKITTNVIADNAVGITQLNVSDGSAGQFLKTDGSGTLSFATVSGTTINNNADNRVITGSGTANTLEGEANFIFDGTHVGVGMTPAPVGSDTVLSIYNSATPRIKLHNSTTGTASGDGAEINMSSSDFILENREAGNVRLFNNGSERMRIDSSGNVGIGISPSNTFSVGASGTVTTRYTSTDTSAFSLLQFENSGSIVLSADHGNSAANSNIIFKSDGATERMRIDSSGKVGIGETSPSKLLHIASDTNYEGIQIKGAGHKQITIESTQSSKQALVTFTTASQNMSIGLETDNAFIFHSGTASAERMRIDTDGKVGINTTTMDATLNSYAGGTNLKAAMFHGLGGNKISFAPYISNGAFSSLSHVNDVAILAESAGGIVIAHATSGNNGIRIVDNGDLEVGGALSKGSGSFRIDHPLESKKDTHYLVHSFIEGPQADNIYRGKVDLVKGSATVNIDTAAGMTEGTFVALNTNVQCFTSNETDWDSVKGTVSGNTLTISCQNASSTATVSWLVIGERQDQHMKDTRWTNDEGKVIVEPLKPTDDEE